MDGPRLSIRIRPSRRLRAGLLACACLALAAPWLSDLPVFPCVLADLCVLFVAARAAVLIEPRRPVELLADECGWTLREGAEAEAVEPLTDSTVWPGLIVLRLASRGGTRELVLLQDSADAAELRRLRAALRLRAGNSGSQDRVDGPV
jgi:hypothetical protein